MEIIKDYRILKAISNRYNLKFDKDYKYIINGPYGVPDVITYKGKEYKVTYFSGCFNPFLVFTGRVKMLNDGYTQYKEQLNYYKTSDIGKTTYFYIDNLTSEKRKALYKKYYNIEFGNGCPEYIPELKQDIMMVHN